MESRHLKKGKSMHNKRTIFFLILCMGIGFAVLSTTLAINSTAVIKGHVWNVYLDNVNVLEGSVPGTTPVISENLNSVECSLTLTYPGDKYEFTVDVVNDGDIDAQLEYFYLDGLWDNIANVIDYSVTYVDGGEVTQGDMLYTQTKKKIKVSINYRTDIEAEDLLSSDISRNLYLSLYYVQATTKRPDSNFVKLVKSSALSDSSIDFSAISSASNGRGLYVKTGTENYRYPIYYYRGAVTNNNAKFAGYCWKIVRTTVTGGTKLVYNGTPNATTGECDATGDATQLATTSAFNTNSNSPAYNGYMYGTVYENGSVTTDSSHVYGNTFTYENGVYTLSDTHAGVDTTHHYTCLSSSASCESVKYVYYVDGSTAYYITLSGGKSVENAFTEMNTNTNNSTIKTAVDNWFHNTFETYFTTNEADYNDYLEDTVWCNDRSMNTLDTDGNGTYTNSGWKPNGGSTSNYLRYGAFGRMAAGTPSLTCSDKNDSFTVEESATGNGALTYPVGLLTADEMNLAGGQFYSVAHSNNDFYLYTNQYWWSLSSYRFDSYYAGKFHVSSDGVVDNALVYGVGGVRPSISLKPGVKIASGGDGSAQTPYEFVLE